MKNTLVQELLGVKDEPINNPPEKYDCSNIKKEKPKRGEIFDNFIIC